ncbi:ATP synthase I chain [Thermoactinomyces sp. DSM 45891]|uniref:ATP synthase subunit I n=1 Tax=Thermoactinomyces sp. DSM 45891 TaxID=1761907 RepID=UPI000916D888|nr:ATP synthase subunit I [Thermoactinomyces sp. DSM 45891]SFX63198.1 ATP synthase I chain [Thermoactinomyces sp. DSM 45891]
MESTTKPIYYRVVVITLVLFITLLTFWLLTPHKPLLAGVALGLSVSLYNFLHLARRVRLVGESIVETGAARKSLGMIQRVFMVIFSILLAVRFPEQIDGRGIILGVPACYIFSVFVYFSLPANQK